MDETITDLSGGTVPPAPPADAETRPSIFPAPNAASPPVAPAEGARFDRFVLTRLIGRGGMGEVHLAHDTRLRRDVALKLLTHDDPEETERFVREAHTAARLRHPGIVTIHDAGREPRPYIVMDYIDGTPLSELRLPVRRALECLRDAARAVHYANSEGVIHRDLKPGNLMLDVRGRVVVMDFGLARSLRDKELTVAGRVMGTPSYMSPEQADGQPTDGRTDVYGLGATLYALLTGRPPVDGDTVYAMVWAVLQQEPTPPRRLVPAIPADAETIVLKCLEKEPARRYQTAGELADDLERFLQGDPIQARPASGLYRLQKRVRKNPRLYAVGALGFAGVALTLGILVPRWQGAERRFAEERETALAQMRTTAAVTLQAALAMRRHADLAAMDAFLPALEDACRRAQERAPELAEPHYHLGVMYRALMRFDDALAQQELSLAKEPDRARARYERALLLLRRYDERVEEARRAWWERKGRELARLGGGEVHAGEEVAPPARADLEDDAARALKRRAEDDLKAVAEHAAEIGAGPGRCGRGLLALAEDRLAEGERELDEAVKTAPELAEAHEALGRLAASQGRWIDATRRYAAGIEADRGYLPHRLGRAAAWAEEGARLAAGGGDPLPALAASEQDAQEAARLRPALDEPWLASGRPHITRAAWRQGQGQDPLPEYAAAIESFTHAIECAPGHDEGWLRRGAAYGNQATVLQARGEDPGGLCEKAVADLGEAMKRNPRREETYMTRGITYGNWSEWKFLHNDDPEPLFAAAQQEYAHALELNPGWAEAWLSRGVLYANWARARSARGKDPDERFASAMADYAKAIDLAPEQDETWMRRGNARLNWALWKQGHGQDPAPLYGEALADFDQALRRNPRRASTWERQAIVVQSLGSWLAGRGQDPADRYAAALAGYAHALAINPESAQTYVYRGVAHDLWAHWKIARGEDPAGEAQAALADYAEALKRNPTRAETWYRRGNTLVTLANTRPPGDDLYREALSCYDRALERESVNAEMWKARANAWTNLGNVLARSNRDPGQSFESAISDYGEALKRNAADGDAWAGRGNARSSWATFRSSHGGDPGELFAAATVDFEKALELNPASDDSWLVLGNARANLGLWQIGTHQDPAEALRGALAAFTKAIERNPTRDFAYLRRGHAGVLLAPCLAEAEAKGVLAQADADLGHVLEKTPAHPDALRFRGGVRLQQGRWADALADLEAAAKADPAAEAKVRGMREECKAHLSAEGNGS